MSDLELENFRYNLKRIRCFLLMNSTEFGIDIHYDGKRLSEVEKGRLKPCESLINKICTKMDLTKDELLLQKMQLKLSYDLFSTN